MDSYVHLVKCAQKKGLMFLSSFFFHICFVLLFLYKNWFNVLYILLIGENRSCHPNFMRIIETYSPQKDLILYFSGTQEKRQNKQMDFETGTSCATV